MRGWAAQKSASDAPLTQGQKRLRRLVRWIISIPLALATLAACVLIVFVLLARARESRAIAEAAPRLGRLIQAGDARVFVQEQGPPSGETVVLVHGTGAWSELWRDTIDPLAQAGFHVIALDVPPFGFSEKLSSPQAYSLDKQTRRIAVVLDALHVARPAIVCHSVGCRPVMELALEQPGRLGRLVLVDPALGFAADQTHPHYDRNHPGWLLRAFFSVRPLRNAVVAAYGTSPPSIRPIFNSFVFNRGAVTDRRLKILKQPLVLQGMTNAEADWLEHLIVANDPVLSADLWRLQTIATPVTMIWGRQDNVTPLWQSQALLTLIPGSRLRVIDGAGHIPYIENVSQFNEVLFEILRDGAKASEATGEFQPAAVTRDRLVGVMEWRSGLNHYSKCSSS